jgi:hypothetical protein
MQDVTIFYFSFNLSTYIPITVDSLEKYPTICRFIVPGSGKEADILRRALANSTKGKFDNSVVRLKASGLVEQEVFIDMDGGVLFGRGGVEKRLSESDFKSVKALMHSLAKEHGCADGE